MFSPRCPTVHIIMYTHARVLRNFIIFTFWPQDNSTSPPSFSLSLPLSLCGYKSFSTRARNSIRSELPVSNQADHQNRKKASFSLTFPPLYKKHFPRSYWSKMAASMVRQNFHTDTEALINKQINMELYASYVYMSMVGAKLFASLARCWWKLMYWW